LYGPSNKRTAVPKSVLKGSAWVAQPQHPGAGGKKKMRRAPTSSGGQKGKGSHPTYSPGWERSSLKHLGRGEGGKKGDPFGEEHEVIHLHWEGKKKKNRHHSVPSSRKNKKKGGGREA